MSTMNLKLVAAAAMMLTATASSAVGYEVWMSDQTNSQGIDAVNPNGTDGAFLRIWKGSDLDTNPTAAPHVALDVAALFPNALASTGTRTKQLHGMIPSPNHNYMVLSFVASGHIGLVDARTRQAVALWRSTGTINGNKDGAGNTIAGSTASGRQNHLTLWSPDGKHLIVANQNGKLLERIDVTWDSAGNITSAVLDKAATLDVAGDLTSRLAAGQNAVADASLPLGTVSGSYDTSQTALTPAGQHKQNATTRPNNAVICGGMAADGRTTFVTLAGGGLFAVDFTATPMRIVAEWDKSNISPAGCGAAEVAGSTWINAGVYAANVASFAMYKLPTNWPAAPAYYPPNVPKPKVIFQDPAHGTTVAPTNAIQGNNRDAHGFIWNSTRSYIHQFDRVKNNVEVFQLATGARNTYDLTTVDGSVGGAPASVCGTTAGANYDSANPTTQVPDGHPNAVSVSNDPSPDLLDLSPDGSRIFVSTRGPKPLSVSHAAAGSCPGLGIVTLSADGKKGVLTSVIPTTWLNFPGTTNISDPHAVIVRMKDDTDMY